MEKDFVDKIIADYMKKVYGFALSKTMDIDQAEELASRIIFEVYTSLLKAEHVYNVDGYIYRISCNIAARFIMEEFHERNILSREAQKPEIGECDHGKNYTSIREAIAYLSNLQREIIVMYYFQKLKTKEIAKRVNLSQAKVKWHLFDARKQIKAGFKEKDQTMQKQTDIFFSDVSQFGRLSLLNMDVSDYFSSRVSQNIVYSAYHKPKTTIEIAREFSVPVAYIEDEMSLLLENSFVKKLPGNKYLTNVYIFEIKKEKTEKTNQVLASYIPKICDIYVPLLFQAMKNYDKNKIYTPLNDKNFLMWSIISYAYLRKCYLDDNRQEAIKFMEKRKDGGENITIITVETSDQAKRGGGKNGSSMNYVDLFVGDANKKMNPISAWQLLSQCGEGEEYNATRHYMLFENLYNFFAKAGRVETRDKIDKFMRLYEKGFLISKNDFEYVNMIVTTLSESELIEFLPNIPEELKDINKEMGEALFKISKEYFPPHMQSLCHVMAKNALTGGYVRIYLLEYLLSKGILKPLTKNQRQTVNMIMFSDILPYE